LVLALIEWGLHIVELGGARLLGSHSLRWGWVHQHLQRWPSVVSRPRGGVSGSRGSTYVSRVLLMIL
jgi:hypothetical protein